MCEAVRDRQKLTPSPLRCTEDVQVIELYGVSLSPNLVSRMTDSVHGENREWRSRPLTASEALEKKGIAEMKKIVPEALLVILLLAALGGFRNRYGLRRTDSKSRRTNLGTCGWGRWRHGFSMGWDPSGGAIRSLAKQDGQVEGSCRSCIDYRLHYWWTDVSSEPLFGNFVSSSMGLFLVWGPFVGVGLHRRAWRADRSTWVSIEARGRQMPAPP